MSVLPCRTSSAPDGYTLPAFAWFLDQTIGGAVATATHGSSLVYGSLSSQVGRIYRHGPCTACLRNCARHPVPVYTVLSSNFLAPTGWQQHMIWHPCIHSHSLPGHSTQSGSVTVTVAHTNNRTEQQICNALVHSDRCQAYCTIGTGPSTAKDH